MSSDSNALRTCDALSGDAKSNRNRHPNVLEHGSRTLRQKHIQAVTIISLTLVCKPDLLKTDIYLLQGMWQFSSTRRLKTGGEAQTVQDDLESFVLVVLYMVLRYTNHNKIGDLPTIMAVVFDSYLTWEGGAITGEYGKSQLFRYREFIGRDFRVLGNVPLKCWLKVALTAVKEWHEHLTRVDVGAHADDDAEDEDGSDTDSDSSVAPNENLKKPMFSNHDEFLDFWRRLILRPDWPTEDGAHDRVVDYCRGMVVGASP
ncbi:hypothetical protein Hypma_004780 [Hypsizygus marmoreus]|uniref:Fungal-type protein kinase domain-containing protein n=1 Tax=Hypsizygus marmoreus TaxID=39966 RepID=A0A369IZM3_HYPMA|nr:hypothetical protein Hypma_004780 [Hypsizygus marmoreus]